MLRPLHKLCPGPHMSPVDCCTAPLCSPAGGRSAGGATQRLSAQCSHRRLCCKHSAAAKPVAVRSYLPGSATLSLTHRTTGSPTEYCTHAGRAGRRQVGGREVSAWGALWAAAGAAGALPSLSQRLLPQLRPGRGPVEQEIAGPPARRYRPTLWLCSSAAACCAKHAISATAASQSRLDFMAAALERAHSICRCARARDDTGCGGCLAVGETKWVI